MSKLFPQTIDEYAEEMVIAAKRAVRLSPNEVLDTLTLGAISGISQNPYPGKDHAFDRITVILAARHQAQQSLKRENRL